MSDSNSSTIKSYIDSAAGTIQNAIGNITGSTADQTKGEAKQQKADAEHDLSHSVGKAGPFTVSGTGAVTKDSSDRTEGSWNQTVGAAKEAVGGLVGSESLKQEGQQQNAHGKGQEAEGQLTDLGKGVGDRVQGSLGAAVAGLTGDRAEQARYQDIHDSGKTLQRGVEADLQKQAPK